MLSLSRCLGPLLFLLGSASVALDASARAPSPAGAGRPHEVEPEPLATGARLIAWLRAQAPAGVEVSAHEGDVTVTYEAKDGDTLASVARALLPLSSTYVWADFAQELTRANPSIRSGIKAGMRLVVPNVVREAHAQASASRLGWPKDEAIKGVYMRGSTAAGHAYVRILDKLVEHGMNAIVLDAKDTDGVLTYASKVPLAV
jgi:hypothetical protein